MAKQIYPKIYNVKHIRLRDRIMARLFGKYTTTQDDGVIVSGYQYKGVLYVTKAKRAQDIEN